MSKIKKAEIKRSPLSYEELEKLTINDLYKLKLTDEETSMLREINRLRQERNIERGKRLDIEEEPIVADLRTVGLELESVWDLVSRPSNYPEAIPILLKHLQKPYSDRTREGIARALSIRYPVVRAAWPILVKEYCNTPEGWGIVAPDDTVNVKLGAKDGLACALCVAVTDETLEEFINLVKDPANGDSRILLLKPLRKSKNPLAKMVLEELASDPVFAKEIGSWNKKGRRDD
ncbi:hypothetical protein [Methylovulum miyakonense]|uniref:hypothetical protein n=1 Tax=Methylovulum miyakonense TaxID=645578 RepID=UPI00037352D6|nr:hypothetical protein [Methylovulum miyakonense]